MRLRPGIIVAVVMWPSLAAALEHPPPLPEEAGCERWLGGAKANDPSIRLNLILCNRNGVASGHVQWSSLESGWNVREITGTITDTQVVLRDVRIVEEKPQPGWRFCTIDRWELTRNGNRLEGTYDSAACNDHATVWFDRMLDKAEGSKPPPKQPTVTPSPPSPPPPPRTRDDTGCRCNTTTPDLLAALFLLGAFRRGTKARGAARRSGRPRPLARI
jgi:hypothetical protein